MTSLFAPHWIPAHRSGDDAATFRAWNPPFVELITNDERPPYTEDIPTSARIIVRHYPLSEQYGNRGFTGKDPAQVGREHATTCGKMATYLVSKGIPLSRLLWTGLNEPMLWSDEPPAQTAAYYAAFLTGLHALGLHGVCGNLGVGWPGNTGTDTPVNWAPFEPMRQAMNAGDYLGLHEYWSFAGPSQNWRWWAGRYLQCPWQVPIIITECGLDAGVEGKPEQGWLNLPGNSETAKATTYLSHLAAYEALCRADSRIRGMCIFTFDYGSRNWEKMSIRNSAFMGVFLPWVQQQPAVVPPPPPVTPPGDRLAQLLSTAFGAKFEDLRSSLPRNNSVPWFGQRDLAAVTEIDVHHTALTSTLTWAQVATGEISTHPTWPGIAYSIGIKPAGVVSLLADIDEQRGATGSATHNAHGVQVVCAGNYENDTVTTAMLQALTKVYAALEGYFGRHLMVLGHRDIDATACPGGNLYPLLNAPTIDPAFRLELLAAGDHYQVLQLNPDAALQRVIYHDGLSIVSGEFDLLENGVSYVCQKAERLGGGVERVYYCVVGDYANVKFVEK